MKHLQNTSEDSITFVARHFRPGAFSKRRVLRAVMPSIILSPWWRSRTVAAAAAGVVIAAAASVAIFTRNAGPDTDPVTEHPATTVITTSSPTDTVRLEFRSVPLREAAGKIEKAYGIELTGLPDNNPQVTITFEGNATDLLEMLNESLDTKISIRE